MGQLGRSVSTRGMSGLSLTPSTALRTECSTECECQDDPLTLALQRVGDRKPVSTTTAYS